MFYSRSPGLPFRGGNFLVALVLAAVALLSYCSTQEFNAVTGEKQYVGLSQKDEIALGLHAAPGMAQQYGGLDGSARAQALVDEVGSRIVASSAVRQTAWRFEFHVLADTDTVNAFALPGGQVFITRALLDLLKSDDQLAGVLAHEIGHVVARHGAEHIAKQQLSQGLSGAAMVAAGDQGAGQLAAMAGQLINMRYGRQDELESDALGVRFMRQAGYDPQAMLEVMKILAKSGGSRGPEFFNTHPNPENRMTRIREAISAQSGKEG